MIMDETDNTIEAKYINLKWANKLSALKIEESTDSIAIIKTGVNNFELEVTTFTIDSANKHSNLV